jgi:predicted CxxxxCH...CXXCH cytochrome family protein
MRFHKYKLTYIIIPLFLLVLAAQAFAIDAPHIEARGVSCNSCHSLWHDAPGEHIDDTTMNYLCNDCHGESRSATYKENHTGKTTVSDGTGFDDPHMYQDEGEDQHWTLQCINCHDPHNQKQTLMNKKPYASGGAYLESHTVSDILQGPGGMYNTVVVSPTPNWPVDALEGRTVVLGNMVKSHYQVKGNTSDRLTIWNGPSDGILTGGQWFAVNGTELHITWGKMLRTELLSIRPIKNSSQGATVYNASLYRNAKYFNSAGPYSSAYTQDDEMAVCIVCHTRTTALNIGLIQHGLANFPEADMGGIMNDSHDENVGSDPTQEGLTCWAEVNCHNPPTAGFDNAGKLCGDCHGNPPGKQGKLLINSPWGDPIQGYDTTGRTSLGAHMTHETAGFACADCHPDGGPAGSDTHDDRSDNHEINFGFPSDPTRGTYLYAPFTGSGNFSLVANTSVNFVTTADNPGRCANVYCHSDATPMPGRTYKNIWWDDPAVGCDDCHGVPGTNKVATAMHDGLHTNGPTYDYECFECHALTMNNYARTIDTAAGYPSNVVNDVAFSNISGGGSYDDPTQTCNVYCHSDGQAGNPYGAPQWNSGTANQCDVCHDIGGASTSLSDAHPAHTDSLYSCQDCHEAVVSGDTGIIDNVLHINRAIDVDIMGANGGDANSYQGDNTCINTFCHGDGSPAWDNTSLSDKDICVKCHGDPTALDPSPLAKSAPGAGGVGIDTEGDIDASDPQVGAHQAHMEATEGMTEPIACDECHTVPSAQTIAGVLEADHIDDSTPAEVPMDGALVTNGGVLDAIYNEGTGECSSTYCHDGALTENQYGSGSAPVPVWNDTTLFESTDPDATKCGICHGFPPPSSHPDDSACKKCHGMMVDIGNSITNTTLHINGAIDGGGCTNCHDTPPYNIFTIVNSQSNYKWTNREAQYNGSGWGAHQKHDDVGITVCEDCHAGGGSEQQHNNTSGATELNIGFVVFDTPQGEYRAPAIPNTNYLLVVNTPDTEEGTDIGKRECTNIYCHSDGGDYDGTKTYPYADWDDPTSPLACDACHGDQGGNDVVTNVHWAHVTEYGIACYVCHSVTVDSGDNLLGNTNHVNKQKEVFFSGSLTQYAQSENFINRPSCKNTYCHSLGDIAPASPPSDPRVTAMWNAPQDSLTCGGCHDEGGLNSTLSGAHEAHTDGTELYLCQDCHATVAIANSAISPAGLAGLHVDGTAQVYIMAANGGDGTRYQGDDTCDSTYCHGVTTGSDTWFTDLLTVPGYDSCTICHGLKSTPGSVANAAAPGISGTGVDTAGDAGAGDLEVGAHQVHLEATDGITQPIACDECHTVPGVAKEAGHMNAVTEVPLEGTLAVAGPNANPGGTSYIGGKCYNTYCHDGAAQSKGYGSGLNNAPSWNNTGYFEVPADVGEAATYCGQCHGYPPPGTTHGNGTETTCGGCHNEVVGPNHYTIIDTTLHINGSPDGGGCTSCHTKPPVNADSIVNGGSTYGFTGRETFPKPEGAHVTHESEYPGECEVCHTGGQPTSGQHDNKISKTQVNIGFSAGGDYQAPEFSNSTFYELAWDGSTTGGPAGGSNRLCNNIYCHSDGGAYGAATPGYVSVDWDDLNGLGCDECHGAGESSGDYVTTDAHPEHVATYGDRCDYCHDATVDSGLNITGNHADGIKNIAFSNVAIKDTGVGPTQYTSPPACTTSYCHSQGMDTYGAPNVDPPTWNAGTQDCTYCHDAGTSMDTESHNAHVNGVSTMGRDFYCVDCHMATLQADGSLDPNKIGNHVDGKQDVLFNSVYGGTIDAGRQCLSVYCHSDGNTDGTVNYQNLTWNDPEFTDCTMCHGDGAGGVSYPAYTDGGVGGDSNSHLAHVDTNAIGCHECHKETTADGTSINGGTPANHINKAVEV